MFSTFDVTTSYFKSVESKTLNYTSSRTDENYGKKLVFVGLTPRSRFGCLVCRKKKKRCDEIKPMCGLCSKTNQECIWKAPGTERRNRKRKSDDDDLENQGETDQSSMHRNTTITFQDEDIFRSESQNSSISTSSSDEATNPRSPSFSDSDLFNGEFSYLDTVLNKDEESQQDETNHLNRDNENNVTELDNHQSILLNTNFDSVSASPIFNIYNSFLQDIISPKSFKTIEQYMESRAPTPINELNLLPLDESQQVENLQDRNGLIDEKKLIKLNNSIITNPSMFNSKITKNEYGKLFFEFYRFSVVHTISIVPENLNYYINFFLPVAQANECVLSCLTTWGGLALYGKDNHIVQEHIAQSLDLVHKQELKSSSHQEYVVLLVCYIILMSANIYSGDVSMDWFQFFMKCHHILKNNIGIKNFKNSNEKWLVINFIYHDLLTSHHHEYGTFLTHDELNEFYQNGNTKLISDSANQDNVRIEPLQGLLMPIYSIISEIIKKSVELKTDYLKLDLDIENIQENINYYEKFDSAFESLDNKINEVQPNKDGMNVLSQENLEVQLRLFELLRIVTKLYIRQILKKYSPNIHEMQYLVLKSLNLLKDLITSEVKSTLCFPLLIVGINCSDSKSRNLLESYFDCLQNIYHVKNIEKCLVVITEVWKMNIDGDRWVDWFKVTKDLNWFLNLA